MKDEYSVGMLDRTEPVRDHHGRTTFEQAVQRLADHNFGLGVDARGRFIQDEEPGIVRESTREADQLPLPDGKCRAALADIRLDTFRQGVQERAKPYFAQGALDARVANFFVAQTDICFESAGKQEGILKDDAELAPQIVHVVPPDIDTVEKDFPALNF